MTDSRKQLIGAMPSLPPLLRLNLPNNKRMWEKAIINHGDQVLLPKLLKLKVIGSCLLCIRSLQQSIRSALVRSLTQPILSLRIRLVLGRGSTKNLRLVMKMINDNVDKFTIYL